ncbi:MAG: ABC transporter permease [Planctomycetota bacterium]|nr:ABC transporter permease [Planctomycetota bacterium]
MTETGNEKSTGFWRTAWKRYRRSRIGMLAFFFLIALAAVAFFAPMLANDKPIVCRIEYTQPGDKTTNELYFPGIKETLRQIPVAGHLFTAVPPFSRMDFKFKKHFKPGRDWAIMPPVGFSPLETSQDRLQGYSGKHWLGTDELGRDVMARMIYGTQVSMRVGFISMGIAALIGLCLGATAGFYGGWPDIVISRIIEIFMCFPVFFLILAIIAVLPPRIENIMIIIGLTRWVGIARLTRGEVLRLRELEYTAAAKALGARPERIIFRHLLPNALAPAMVSITFGIAGAILVESGLSWLGFGVQDPNPSWGNILKLGYELKAEWMIMPACAAIFVAVLSFNLIGDTLRDVIDPRTRGRGEG